MARLRLGVALLLPPPLDREVDALRRACGDTSVERVPPHCTLVPPVNVGEDDLDRGLARLRAAGAATRPFTLDLGPPATFWPASPVLYLAVAGEVAAVHALRQRLWAEPLARPLTWPFHPHVTLADEASPERLSAAVAALADYRASVTLERVHLLQEQRGGHGRRVWRPVADIPFERPAVVGRGGLELELAVTDRLDPEAARLAEAEGEGGRHGEPAARELAVAARRGGRVVGAAVGWTSGPAAFLDDLTVAADCRRQGIGAHLVATFLTEATRRGCRLARTRTEAGGPAEGFWRRLGWVEEARFDVYALGRDFRQLRRDLAGGYGR
ncbi:MAG: GNAT family N-acetyltransferase [Acidimicrobiales bacterium]